VLRKESVGSEKLGGGAVCKAKGSNITCAAQSITGAHSDSTAITRLAQLELSAKGETASDGVVDR
jgi:hypothetical protein